MSSWLACQVWQYEMPPLPKGSHLSAIMVRWVLFALCDIANDDGTHCYPSVSYLAWKTDCSRPVLYRIIDYLQQEGILVAVGSAGDMTAYDIHLDVLPEKPAWERPRKGRPRGLSTNVSPREKSCSLGETFTLGRNVSPREKSRLPGRKVLSQGEKSSPRDTAMLADDTSFDEDSSGVIASEQCAESLLLTSLTNQSYESRGADAPKISQKKAKEKRPEPDQLERNEWVASHEWASTRAGQAWMRNHGYSVERRSSSSEFAAYRTYMREKEAVHA